MGNVRESEIETARGKTLWDCLYRFIGTIDNSYYPLYAVMLLATFLITLVATGMTISEYANSGVYREMSKFCPCPVCEPYRKVK